MKTIPSKNRGFLPVLAGLTVLSFTPFIKANALTSQINIAYYKSVCVSCEKVTYWQDADTDRGLENSLKIEDSASQIIESNWKTIIKAALEKGEFDSLTKLDSNDREADLKRKLATIFVAGLFIGAFLSGIWQGFNAIVSSRDPRESLILSRSPSFSRAEYERLKIDMPLEAVEAILGQGIEINQTSTTATFIWEKADRSKITVIFEHEKLKSKSQSGLN